MTEPEPGSPSPAPPGRSRLRQVLADLGPAAPLLVVAVVGPLLGTAVVVGTTGHWLPWFGDDLGSLLTFVALGVTAAAGCLLPTHATSLLAGYLFGAGLGAFTAWLVVLLAATLGFALLRPLVGERAVRALAGSPRAMVVHRALFGRGFWRTVWIVALLRLSPVLPFAATNLVLAALGLRGPTFLVATVVGITPRALGVAWVGAELSDLDWQQGGSLASTAVAVGATLLVLVVIGRIARRALRDELPASLPPA